MTDGFRLLTRLVVCLASASVLAAQAPVRSLYQLDGSLTGPSGRDAEQVVREFLAAGEAPGVRAAGGFERRLAGRAALAGGAVERLTFERAVAGVPLYGGETLAFVDESGRLLRLTEAPEPAIPATLAPALSAREALDAVAPRTSGWRALSADSGPELETRWELPGGGWGAASLVWFDRGGRAVPAWRVDAQPAPHEAWETLVDAVTGEILLKAPLFREAAPSGRVFPAGSKQPYPGGVARSLESFAGWPAGDCPNEPSAGAAESCWTDGVATAGNNADVCLDLDQNNLCDGRALGSGGVFDFSFWDSLNLTNDPAPDRNAALANAFYWVNVAHDWFYRLGFNEAAGAFQSNNFGRGGAAGDPVHVDVQDGALTNNANFLTPPDGIAGRMQLGLFPGVRRDPAFDPDIILHEYGHGVSNRLVGGPSSVAGLFLWQSGAMGEGWSDAFAISFSGDPVMAEYSTRNAGTGIRTVRYDQSPRTFGDFGVLRPILLPGTTTQSAAPQVHADGEIWASTLWDLRTALGKDLFERVVVLGLALTPSRPSMLDARDAILQAGQTLGASSCAMWSAFAGRGMGASAALNPIEAGQPNDTALSVFEAFDPPPACGGAPPDYSRTLFLETLEEPASWSWAGYVSRSSRRAAGGQWSWYFGVEQNGNYNLGGSPFNGWLYTPSIDLRAAEGAILEWDQFFRGEGFGRRIDMGGVFAPYLNRDSGRIWISDDDGASWRTLTHIAHDTPGQGFVHFRINLRRYVGKIIRLRFDFHTFDGVANEQEGWYLDNIRVGTNGAPRTLEVSPAALSGTVGSGAAPTSIGAIAVSGDASWSTTIVEGAAWLTRTPSQGSGAATVDVRADPRHLPPGVYAGRIRIDGGAAGAREVAVSLTVGSATNALARWSFDEPGAGPGVALADGVGGRTAHTAGKGSTDVAGVVGRARLFNGFTDAAAVAFDAALTPERFTIQTWVKLYRRPESVGILAGAFDGAAARGWYLAVDSLGRLVFMGASPPSSTPWLMVPPPLIPMRWYLATATVDRTTGRVELYLNGTLAASRVFPGIAAPQSAALTFGAASWTSNYHAYAALDELEILSGIQSAAETLAAYEAHPVPPDQDLNSGGDWIFSAQYGSQTGGLGPFTAYGGGTYVEGFPEDASRLNGIDESWVVPNADERLSPSSWILTGWVRLRTAPASSAILTAHSDGVSRGWHVGVRDDGAPFLAVGRSPEGFATIEAAEGLGIGRWRHLAAAYDGKTRKMSLYLDGELQARGYTNGFTPYSGAPLTIGRASWAETGHGAFDLEWLRLDYGAPSDEQVRYSYELSPKPQPPGALAAWSFEETATGPGVAFTDSIGGHGAVTSGSRNVPIGGVSGVARYFGGWPDSAQIPPHADFAASSFSFSTWVRLDELPQSWGVLFSNYGGGHAGWYVGLYHDGRIILSVCGPGSKPWLLSSAALEVGRWHHLSVTFEGAGRRGLIYLDGVRVGSAVFPAWAPASGVAPTWGRASWVNSVFLKFAADEARLYGYERSPEEVAADYEAHASVAAPSPAAVWEFDGDSGAVADQTGGGHAIALTPFVAVTGGVTGQARDFRGRPDSGSIAPSADLGSEAFTWMSWVKLETLPNRWGVLYGNFGGAPRGWYVGVHTDGRVIFSVSGPGSSPWLLSATGLSPGRWHHVAVTFDPVSRRGAIVIDGTTDRTAVFPASAPETAVAPTWGKASWTDSYYLPVAVDRARFFTRDLTTTQILDWQ